MSASTNGQKKWFEIYPELSKTAVTAEQHISEGHFAREISEVFRKTWLFAGLATDISNPGDHFVREFKALKASIILVRGTDSVIRAFHNVCRHRCAKLLPPDAQGCKPAITCEFHGWSYGLDGRLLGVPDADGVLQKEELGLVPIHVGVWNGFVFVNLQQEPKESFQSWLGQMSDHPMNKFPFMETEWESWGWRLEVDANWKVVKDLFVETYHVAFLHRETIDRIYTSPSNPYHHFAAIDFYDKHHKGTAGSSPPTHDMKLGAIAKASVKWGGASVSRFGKAKQAAPGLNPNGIENWGLDQYGMFPNFNVHLFGGLWHYHLFEPVAANRCVWENRIFFPKSKNAGEFFAHAFSQSLQVVVGLEDLAAAERNQAGMETGATPNLALHDQEIQLKFMRKTIADYMNA